MKKKLVFYLMLLSLIAVSFFLGYNFSENQWKCRACAYSSGNVQPLVNENYFPILLKEINNANSNIDIALYEFKFYETNNSATQIREALVNAQKRGVKIRMILDQSQWYGKITDLSKENQKTAEYLSERGISVKLDSIKTTTHDKLIIIDNETVIVGSHNWGSSALTKNNEASVMIKDSAIAEYYENYFNFLWNS